MHDKTFKKNIIINAFQQLVTYLLPFITVPYLTRVIGANGIGIYSYTNSIVQYFILFGSIGLTLYGTRQIAYVRDDQIELEEEFWRIFLLRVFFSCCSLIIYIAFIYLICSEYKIYMLIHILTLLGSIIDISWFYHGIEDFSKLAKRIVLFKLLGTVGIFLFVTSREDVWIYVLIQCLTIFVGNIFLWLSVLKIIKIRKVSIKSIFSHLKPSLVLFIPQIAIEIYAVFDKTMIGLLADVTQVGLYTKAEEFAKVPLMMIAVLATVLFPKLSNQYKNEGINALNESLKSNLQMVTFIGVGASFGIAGIAKEFIIWMMGSEFLGAIPYLCILAPLTFIIGTSNMIGRQYLLPANRSNIFTITVILGAAINFVVNVCLIPLYGGIGACVATVFAELSVTIAQFMMVKKVIDLKLYFSDLAKCILSGLIMFITIRVLGSMIQIYILNTAIQIFVGGIIYWILLYIFRNNIALKFVKLLKFEIGRM